MFEGRAWWARIGIIILPEPTMSIMRQTLPLLLFLAPIPAMAAVAATGATPAEGARAAGVRSVSVAFSEPVQPALSGLTVVMTGMPGMEGMAHAMKIAGVTVKVSPDGRTLVGALARPLPVGTYTVTWHAAGTDGKRVSGTVSFAVTKG
ncbi:MAG: hypothetical protein RIS94_1402 [Pseudomonadota bacterium]